MYKLILLTLIFSHIAKAKPEFYRTERVWAISLDTTKRCSFDYCRSPDGGDEMKFWCIKNNSPWGNDPILIGWTKRNGLDCFCGCNNRW